MAIMAVTRVFEWVGTQKVTKVCILSDSMSMIRKVQVGLIHEQWIEALRKASLKVATFIFMLGHVGV